MGWPGPTTHRQSLVWAVWLAEEWDRPNRSDWYLMAVALHARAAQLDEKGQRSLSLDRFKVAFDLLKKAAGKGGGLTKEDMVAVSKAMWMGASGYDGPGSPGHEERAAHTDRGVLRPKVVRVGLESD